MILWSFMFNFSGLVFTMHLVDGFTHLHLGKAISFTGVFSVHGIKLNVLIERCFNVIFIEIGFDLPIFHSVLLIDIFVSRSEIWWQGMLIHFSHPHIGNTLIRSMGLIFQNNWRISHFNKLKLILINGIWHFDDIQISQAIS